MFEKGHAPHVQILFETASSKYAYLNTIVAYATGGPNAAGDIALDVWQVSLSKLTVPLFDLFIPSANPVTDWGIMGVYTSTTLKLSFETKLCPCLRSCSFMLLTSSAADREQSQDRRNKI